MGSPATHATSAPAALTHHGQSRLWGVLRTRLGRASCSCAVMGRETHRGMGSRHLLMLSRPRDREPWAALHCASRSRFLSVGCSRQRVRRTVKYGHRCSPVALGAGRGHLAHGVNGCRLCGASSTSTSPTSVASACSVSGQVGGPPGLRGSPGRKGISMWYIAVFSVVAVVLVVAVLVRRSRRGEERVRSAVPRDRGRVPPALRQCRAARAEAAARPVAARPPQATLRRLLLTSARSSDDDQRRVSIPRGPPQNRGMAASLDRGREEAARFTSTRQPGRTPRSGAVTQDRPHRRWCGRGSRPPSRKDCAV